MNMSLHRVKKIEIIPNQNSTGNLTLKITHDQTGTEPLHGEYSHVEAEFEIILFHGAKVPEIKVRDSEGVECDLDYILSGGR